MLKFLSKQNRARKALLVGFIVLLAIGLIGFFGPSWEGLQGSSDSEEVIASVGSYEITVKDLKQALAARGQQMAQGRGTATADDPATVYQMFGTQIIDDLIRQKLIRYDAEQHRLHATDEEVQARIKQMFTPWPGADRYRQQLQQAGLTPIQFEDDIRALVAEEKLRSFVSLPARVSAQEVEDEYKRNSTTYSVKWVEVDPGQLRDKVTITDAELVSYFDQHKSEFKINVEQRKARYILIDERVAGETISVPDEELKQNFNPNLDVRQARVSQIVINIPKTTAPAAGSNNVTPGEEEARKKADDIVARAKGTNGKPAEDFAALARQVSEDPKTKASGGDLGWIRKSDKRPADDPLNRVFSLQKDEISPAIKGGDKLYIFKVADRVLATFEEAKPQLLREARVTKGYSKAIEIATEAENLFRESKDSAAVVSQINQKYGVQVASVKETPFFAEGDNLPGIGVATELQGAIFKLQNVNDIAGRMNVSGGMAIGQYLERRDPHDPNFEEVKSNVTEKVRDEKAIALALERARQLGNSASPDALFSAAKAMGLRPEERDGLTGSDSIGPIVTEESKNRVYKLKEGEILRDPIKADNSESYVVVGMSKRKEADMGEPFQKERKSTEERLLDTKRNILFTSYIASVKKRLTDEGKIKIYRDVADQAIGSAPPSRLPGGMPNMPGGMRQGRPSRQGALPQTPQ